jgi:hypothetical protein
MEVECSWCNEKKECKAKDIDYKQFLRDHVLHKYLKKLKKWVKQCQSNVVTA